MKKREKKDRETGETGELEVEVAADAEVLVEVKAENEIVEMSEGVRARYEEHLKRIGGK